MTEIILAIEDVPAVMAQLPDNLRNGNCGIMYDDGKLIVQDDAVAGKIKNAVASLAKGHKMHLKTFATSMRKRKLNEGSVSVDGNDFATDEFTHCRVASLLMSADRDTSKQFYCESLGGPVQLDADALRKVLDAICDHADKCFETETALHDKIEKGKMTAKDIEAAAWPRG
jgi:Domain of unknown function (DUF4376)